LQKTQFYITADVSTVVITAISVVAVH